MSIIPVLLKPRLLTIKNRWLKSGNRGLRELFAAVISVVMMCGIYTSTLSTLRDAKRLLPGVTIDPTVPLGVMLATLFLMIFLSAAVTAAADLGLCEPDPRDDLLGVDVRRKVVVLARELGLRLQMAV